MSSIPKPPIYKEFGGRNYARYGRTQDKETAYSAARKMRKEGRRARVIKTHGSFWVYVTGRK